MNDAESFAWWHVGYRWFLIRVWWRRLPERLAWWCAWALPRQVALFAFVRVYSAWGECGPDYAPVYDAWAKRAANRDPAAALAPHPEKAE